MGEIWNEKFERLLWFALKICLFLGNVFKKIRNSSLKAIKYGFISHYLRASALSWDAMLNMTNVELELISNADIFVPWKSYERLLIFLRDIAKPAVSI